MDTFRGVTCIDVTLSDLFSEATYFSRGLDSYAFIVDGQTRLLTHPLLPRPSDVYDDPVSLRVLDLEVDPMMKTIVENYLLLGIPGTEEFSSRRVFSRGDSEHDGVDTVTVNSVYIWKPIRAGNLTVCVVVDNANTSNTSTVDTRVDSFPYHRIDITKPPGTCRYLNRLAITDTSTIKFASYAFLSPDFYLELKETSQIIKVYEEFFKGSSSEGLFQPETKAAVAISTVFDDVISRNTTAWQEAVWRYLGLREGVFRLFPGSKLVPKYDHTVRTWYKRAQSQRKTITFSKPYIDAFGAGIVITLSKTIFESESSGFHKATDFAAGVMGMDFSMDLFNSIFIQHLKECSDKKCFIIDNSGYIIFHPNFENVQEEDIEKIENIHITQKEQYIAHKLIKANVLSRDGCINFKKRQIQSFYRISRESYSGTDFELTAVQGSNIYIIHKTTGLNYDNTVCHCAKAYGSEIPACDGYQCECPCFNRQNFQFDQCSATFLFDREIGALPPCTPPAPPVNLSSVATDEQEVIKDLEYCYPVEKVCPERKNQLNCSATAGCRWCSDICSVRRDDGCTTSGRISHNVIIAVAVVGIVLFLILILIIICIVKRKGVKCQKGTSEGTDNLGMAMTPERQRTHVSNTTTLTPSNPTPRTSKQTPGTNPPTMSTQTQITTPSAPSTPTEAPPPYEQTDPFRSFHHPLA